MAGTAADLRVAQNQLTKRATADLSRLWSPVSNPIEGRKKLERTLPGLIDRYGKASSTVSAQWYADARDLAGARGRFRPTPARISDNAVQALALWATSSGTGLDAIFTLVAGGFNRRVLDWGRQTITQASLDDDAAEGWVRVGSGGCDWCAQYLDGEVRTVEGYDFKAHDHCHCTAVPAFRGAEPPSPMLKRTAAADTTHA